MSRSHACAILLIWVAGAIGGCSSDPEPQPRAKTHDQRAVLNEGYSLLYSDISSISHFDLIFLVKVESDTVEQVAKEATAYAGVLKKTLEDAARDYPAVNIELDPLPAMEKRKRAAVMKNGIKNLAPFIGLSGKSFERRALQSLEGSLNQVLVLCKVMAEEEPEPGLKRLLTEAQGQLEGHYASVLGLLRERYYVNSGERKVAE